ncbi:MAG: peptidoglycan DD-metalloendopeptidase family protein [Aggregatilineales bacterium]
MTRWLATVGLLLSALLIAPARSQDECGTATSLVYPVDTAAFRLVQDFGAPSPRHQGRYHTGEDWAPPRDDVYGVGQPVRAAASGRVTYSAPQGWGRDGGVVIIQHTFADGSVIYTQYGHLVESETARLPVSYTCVRQGDVIGAVGSARPAPHLHFEVRVSGPDIPGPGYTWENPLTAGFRHPARLIQNWQTWTQPYALWRVELPAGLDLPPAELPDHSLVYASGGRAVRITPDGRVLWRLALERPLAATLTRGGRPLLLYADGRAQQINLDGSLGERWDTGAALAGPPLIVSADLLVFPTSDGGLAAFDPDLRAPLWTAAAGLAPPLRAAAGSRLLAFIGADGVVLTLAHTGSVLDTARLREPGSLAAAPDGALLVYTVGGLWTLDAAGSWALREVGAPPGGARSAALAAGDGRLFLFDGAALRAYSRDGLPLWATDLQVDPTSAASAAALARYDELLLLTTAAGHIAAVRAADGGVCGQARVYSGGAAPLWASLGRDGVLRLAADDHILALNWSRFTAPCG